MTSRTRIIAASIAARMPAPSTTANLLTFYEAKRRAEAPAKTRAALRAARELVRKSWLARSLNGKGVLWNGDDRAHQFALLNAAADARRVTVRTYGIGA